MPFSPIFNVPPQAPKPTPHLLLTPTQERYDLGSAITLKYTLVGVEHIPIKPILYCSFGESDFNVTFVVRDAFEAILPDLPRPYIGIKPGTLKQDWLSKPGARALTLNDTVPVRRAGNYRVVAVLHVQRPAGRVVQVKSAPVTITVVDSVALRARRQAAMNHAARLLQDRKGPWEKRHEAVEALRYFDEPHALPVLLQALQDPDLHVMEQAEQTLLLWPDVSALEKAAGAGLAAATAQYTPIPMSKWENLLSSIELRKRFGAKPVPRGASDSAKARARRRLCETLSSGLTSFPAGPRAEHRLGLILYQEAMPDASLLRPVLVDAARMHPDAQERLGWLLSQWEKRPTPDALKALHPELMRLADNPAVRPALRKAVNAAIRQYLKADTGNGKSQ